MNSAELAAQLRSTSSPDSVYLALALLDESHAPEAAFGSVGDGAGAAALDDGMSRSRGRAVIGSLERAVAANPANLAALWHLAFLQESFDDARAVVVWQQLLHHAPGHLQALGRLGEGLLLLERHEQAQRVGERTLALAEARDCGAEAGRARNVLGRAYLHQGKYQLAEEMFESAAANADGSIGAAPTRAWASSTPPSERWSYRALIAMRPEPAQGTFASPGVEVVVNTQSVAATAVN